jgi:SAUR family protein
MCKAAITIPSLVWLRRTVRRWRSRATAAAAAAAAEASSSPSGAAVVVPAGHVAVCVGGGGGDGCGSRRRFVVRVAHLGHPAFRDLLRQAEEEYGFPAAPGPIALPCDEDHFLDVLHRVSSSSSSSSSRSSTSCCCCGLAVRRGRGDDARPLLQGMDVEKLVC